MKEYILIEWWVKEGEESEGGWWQIIGFGDTLEDLEDMAKTRKPGTKLRAIQADSWSIYQE